MNRESVKRPLDHAAADRPSACRALVPAKIVPIFSNDEMGSEPARAEPAADPLKAEREAFKAAQKAQLAQLKRLVEEMESVKNRRLCAQSRNDRLKRALRERFDRADQHAHAAAAEAQRRETMSKRRLTAVRSFHVAAPSAVTIFAALGLAGVPLGVVEPLLAVGAVAVLQLAAMGLADVTRLRADAAEAAGERSLWEQARAEALAQWSRHEGEDVTEQSLKAQAAAIEAFESRVASLRQTIAAPGAQTR